MEHRVVQAHQERRVITEHQVVQDVLDQKAIMEHRVVLARQEQRVITEHQVNQDSQGVQDVPEAPGLKAL